MAKQPWYEVNPEGGIDVGTRPVNEVTTGTKIVQKDPTKLARKGDITGGVTRVGGGSGKPGPQKGVTILRDKN